MSTAPLAGRVAIVTGGASGIGRATALAFARQGARVCVADLDAEGAERVAKEISGAGGDACAVALDVTDAAQNEAAVRRSEERFGALHVAFLNAGIAVPSTVLGGDVDVFDRTLAVNLRGVFLGLRAVAPALIQAGGGSIVATASVAGLRGGAGMPAYYASKHGVVGLVKAAAAELAPHRIRVNAVCPGIIDTPILGPLHGMKQFTEGVFARLHLVNRVGQPEEVAELVSFLASDRSAFVTGCAWPIDGGITASITPGGASGRLDELG
jgi:NAD(P)-dependent dehydrogenase (short-subunit alcohol dehydrogenase family)